MKFAQMTLRAVGEDEACARFGTPRADLARIYRASFPPSEQLTLSELRAGIRSGTRTAFVLERMRGRTEALGLCITCSIGDGQQAILGEYLAVTPDARRQGWGGVLFRYVAGCAGEAGLDVVFEVEPPVGRGAALAERRDRERFYRSLGATPISCATSYRMPNLAGSGSLPMKLWWISGRGVPAPCGDTLRRYISGIYRHSYGITDAALPLLTRVLRGLPCP